MSSVSRILFCILGLLFGSTGVHAGVIDFGTWYQFSFAGAGAAQGCDPADPSGPFCIPSFGTPTQFADAPPWTIVAPVGGAVLTVTDAFLSGDRFEVFDFGISIGLTSLPGLDIDCGDDPIPCLANAGMSHALLALAAGAHSLTIAALPGSDFGTGYFLASADSVSETPLPPAFGFMLAGLVGLASLARRRLNQSRYTVR
jgi:hypothetical protein